MDYKALNFYFELAQFLLMGLLAIWAYISAKHKANQSAIVNLEHQVKSQINNIDDRLIRVERDIEHLPNHADMAELHTRLNKTNEKLDSLDGQLSQISHTMHLMHEHLLSGGKK